MVMRVNYGARTIEPDPPGSSGRGARRMARPPCTSLAAAIDAIKADIKAGEESLVPDCTTSEVALGCDAVLELHRPSIGPYSEGGDHDLPDSFRTAGVDLDASEGDGRARRYPTATVNDITTYGDREGRAVVQRAASRGIVAAVEAADGFKYSINNAWAAKDADGQRFSYICQDSMQNKDRHANGFPRTQKHLKGEHERGPRKPTYDCKGSVSIKCSMVRRTIDIIYRHNAIHSTVSEQRNTPRPSSRFPTSTDGNAQAGGTAEQGGLLGRIQSEKSAYASPSGSTTPAPQGSSNIARTLKRKREDAPSPSAAGKPPSLFELLKQSEASDRSQRTTPDKPPPAQNPWNPPPVNYDLPSWQKPPPPPPAVVPISRNTQSAGQAQPYQPPYQPYHAQRLPSTTPVRSAPTSKHHPQQHSLPANSAMFSTLKPMPVATSATTTTTTTKTPTPTYFSDHPRSSCTSCRDGKKKCDEVRPVCGGCAEAGKYDCVLDGQGGGRVWVQGPVGVSRVGKGGYGPGQGRGVNQDEQWPQSQAQTGGGAGASGQGQGPGQREESPDPWFPKR